MEIVASGLGKDELEEIFAGRNEAAAAVEPLSPRISALDHDLERSRSLPDRIALGVLKETPPDALGLVLGADEELVDPHRRLSLLEGHVARRCALDLGDENRLALQDAQCPLVGPAVEAREAEEERLVLVPEGTDGDFGHV